MRFLRTALVVAGLAALATPAAAGHCPLDVAAIDAALSANSSLSADQRMVVETLRDRGAALHPSNHGASLAHLHAAMEMLGIAHG